MYIHNKFSPGYQNALAADPDLVQDSIVYRCVTVSQKDALVRMSGIEDVETTVQAVYTYFPDKNVKTV